MYQGKQNELNNEMKLWNKKYISLIITQIITSFSFYMVVTILVSYLTENRGLTAAVAGVIAGLFSITSLVCRPICGLLTDRYNKILLIKISAVMMFVGLMGYGIFRTTILIIIARILHGIGFAISSTAMVSAATECIPEDKMGEGIGYYGLAMVIASAAGPGLGVELAEWCGEMATFIAAAGLCALELAILFRVEDGGKKEAMPSEKMQIEDIIAVKAIGYSLLGSIFSLGNGVIASYLMSYSKEIGLHNVSLYFTLNAVALFIIRPFAGKLLDRKGLFIVAFPSFVIAAISMFMLGNAYRMQWVAYGIIMFSAILRAIGQGAGQPSLQTASIQAVGREKSGTATSTFYLRGDIGQGLGPMIAGAVSVVFYC